MPKGDRKLQRKSGGTTKKTECMISVESEKEGERVRDDAQNVKKENTIKRN